MIFIFLASFLAIFLYQHAVAVPLVKALSVSANTAFAVFLTWALGREIDPANEWSAFVALPAVFFLSLIFERPAFLALLFILLFSRTLNGTSGSQVKIGDSILLITLGALLFYNGMITAPVILAVVFCLDAYLVPTNRKQIIFALVSVPAVYVMSIFYSKNEITFMGLEPQVLFLSMLVLGAALAIIVLTRHNRVYDDEKRLMLNQHRVVAAQALVALFIVGELNLKGNVTVHLLYPGAFACFGVALYHLARLLLRSVYKRS